MRRRQENDMQREQHSRDSYSGGAMFCQSSIIIVILALTILNRLIDGNDKTNQTTTDQQDLIYTPRILLKQSFFASSFLCIALVSDKCNLYPSSSC
jgi:hypothetical protein